MAKSYRYARADGQIEMLESRRLLAGEAVTGFLLINADTDQSIGVLADGATINFQTIGTTRLNVVAQTAGTVESVRFALDADSNYRTENTAPYALAGDSAGNYNPWTPSLGGRTLTATPFTADGAGGVAGIARSVTFNVINQSPTTNRPPVLAAIGNKTVAAGATLSVNVSATDPDNHAILLAASNLPSFASFIDKGNGQGTLTLAPPSNASGTFNGVTITATDNGSPALSDSETFSITVTNSTLSVGSFTLINADTDQPIGTLGNGGVIDFSKIPTRNLNIRADASASAASVRFGLDGNNNFRTENTRPFALAGDSGGNYNAWTPSLGQHTVSATPFSGSNASGTSGAALTVNFSVISGPAVVLNPAAITFSVPQGGTAPTQNVTVSISDAATAGSASYTAFSNAVWLNVAPGAGSTPGTLTLSVNTAGLPLGAHKARLSVKSPGRTSAVIPVTLNVTGSFIADQIHLSFVQDPSRSMTVVWRTMSTSTPSTVEYRALGSATWLSAAGALRTSGTTGTLHETTLTSLAPATTYEYRVRGDSAQWSPIFTTRTMPTLGPADFDAIYFADTGLAGRLDGLDTGTTQTIDEILGLNPDLLLPGGDYAYFDTDKRFGTLDNSIDQWFNQNQPIFSRTPIMPTYGNHEVLLGESYTAWSQRFATPTGFDGRRNYSFDVGDAHFISIFAVENSTALPTATFNWLASDLAAARAAGRRWVIPYFHVPPFADGLSHPSNLALRAQLGPLFEQYDVQVVLTSHDQSFERTYPLAGVPNSIVRTSTDLTGYDGADGVTWIKVSPAGKLSNRNGVNDFSRFTTNPPPFWTAARDDTMHHFTRLIFSASGTLRVETYGYSGDGTPAIIIDSFEYNLGSAPRSTEPVSDANSTEQLVLHVRGRNDPGWQKRDRITADSLAPGDSLAVNSR